MNHTQAASSHPRLLRRHVRARYLVRSCLEALEPRQFLSVNILQWRGDNGGTGNYNQETTLTPANVNSSQFGKLTSISLPAGSADQLYAQPLYVSNLTITGQGTNNGTHNVVILATEANNVYAYDTTTFAKLWSINLGTPVPKNSPGGPNEVNFAGPVGVTGTPVIDPASNLMYLDSAQIIGSGTSSQYDHKIFAINITNGATTSSMTLGNVPGGIVPQIPGTSSDAVNGFDTFIPQKELQRPGLTLLNGTVYVAYGSYGDTDPYHGWVLGFDKNSLALTAVFDTTPNDLPGGSTGGTGHDGEGAIWMAGASLTTDGTSLYLVSANGDFDADPSIAAWGDAALKLTPNSTTSANPGVNGYGLALADYFAPSNQATLGEYNVDLDLGTGGMLLLPTQGGDTPNEAILIGKQGVAYVLNRDNLGQFNAAADNIPQEISLNGHGMWGTPAYFNNIVYFHAAGDVIKAYSLTDGQLSPQPIASGAITITSEGASPVISSNGTSNGIVWEMDNTGVLRAYDAITLAELYDSNINSSADRPGTLEHFAVPIVANGRVFVGGAGFLAVYGEKTNPFATSPGAPTSLAASSTTGGQITLTWSATASQNEQFFAIERSTNGINFSQIATAPIDATRFADTTAAIGQTYFYRVRAGNSAGFSAYTSNASATAQTYSTPIDFYHFDELTGTTTADAGTANITGTLTGSTLPQWSPGYSGGALSFSGDGIFNSTASQSLVQVSNSGLSSTLQGNATVAGWIKTTQTGSDDPTQAPALLGVTRLNGASTYLRANTQDGGNDIKWGYLDASGHIGVAVDGFKATANPADTFGVVSADPINDGQWHFVAFTRTAATGILQVFVDGVLQGTFVGDTGNKSTAYNFIGAQLEETSNGTVTGKNFFNGSLDELRIYNQVLPASEILALASMPATPVNPAAVPLSSSSIQLTWTNSPVLGTSIEIDRRTGTSGSFSPLITLNGTVNSYTDASLTPGTQYAYELKAINAAGSSVFTTPITATPTFAQILARNVFYNNSSFDGNSPAANSGDASAIDPTKSPLLPGQTASFANYTSSAAGLNGVSIDIANLFVPANVSLSDFAFKSGNSSDPSTWSAGPAPDAMAILPAAGINGSTRIEFTWNPANAIKNAWLQIAIAANSDTNLSTADLFYFGNAPGDSGNSPTDAKTTAVDVIAARAHATTGVPVSNPYDFNHDGKVDSSDEDVALANQTSIFDALQLISAPASFSLAPAGQPGAALPLISPTMAQSSTLRAVEPISTAPQLTPQLLAPPQAANLHATSLQRVHKEPGTTGFLAISIFNPSTSALHQETILPHLREKPRLFPMNIRLIAKSSLHIRH